MRHLEKNRTINHLFSLKKECEIIKIGKLDTWESGVCDAHKDSPVKLFTSVACNLISPGAVSFFVYALLLSSHASSHPNARCVFVANIL